MSARWIDRVPPAVVTVVVVVAVALTTASLLLDLERPVGAALAAVAFVLLAGAAAHYWRKVLRSTR